MIYSALADHILRQCDDEKRRSASGVFSSLISWRGALLLDPCWGLCRQTLLIGSCSAFMCPKNSGSGLWIRQCCSVRVFVYFGRFVDITLVFCFVLCPRIGFPACFGSLLSSMRTTCPSRRRFLPERDYVTFGSLLSQILLSVVCLPPKCAVIDCIPRQSYTQM